MTFRLFNTLAIAWLLPSVGLPPAQAQDFTLRATGDDAVDLPQRLTTGTWFYTVTYQTDDDDAPSFWLESVDTSCDGSALEELSASARNKRLTVGPYPANICAGWHEVDPIDFQLRDWSIRFVKEGGGGQPPPTPPTTPGDGTLQSGQFGVVFGATANGDRVDGQLAAWASDKGILFWLFDSQNPEALFKVLDGRSVNGHWWMDLAVTSDLRTATVAAPAGRVSTDTWSILTGPARSIFSGETRSTLVYCAFPSDRSDNRCAISGLGTTLSLRDAWDSQGRIPAKYYTSSVGAAIASEVAAPPSWIGRELLSVAASHP
ncbi:MAG: hypothetical protein OXH32_18250 [Acidobacteria bacterium]|nr:hypothetical protein [Acidobacteriota bacterium]